MDTHGEAGLEEGTFTLRLKDVSSEPGVCANGRVRGRGLFWVVPGCSGPREQDGQRPRGRHTAE